MTGAATLGVLARTLIVVKRYTEAAIRTADAALEQAEAAQKPCIALKTSPISTEDDFIDERVRLARSSRGLPTVVLWNIGSGPALKLSYFIENPKKGRLANRSELVIASSDYFPTCIEAGSLSQENATDAKVTVTYESASSTRYQTVAILRQSSEGDWLVESLRFQKVS